MKLLYATSIRFPSALANRIQVLSMAKAFGKVLGDDFLLSGNEIEISHAHFKIGNLGLKKSYKLAWKTLDFAKREKITHIYSRESKLLFFVVIYNLFFFHLPLTYIYEVHALLGRGISDLIADKFLSFFVKKYIFLTKALSQIYSKKYHISPKTIHIAPDGVDLSIFANQTEMQSARGLFSLPKNSIILGYFGHLKTLTMDKGVSDILEALDFLPDNFLFVAVGGSEDDRREYKALAEEKGVIEKTRFEGHVSQKELALYQRACDILLMPFPDRTHFTYYMSPLKMFEYMASERPIITTNLPSIREILSEDIAMIVPPENPRAIADAVLRLSKDPELRKKLGEKARGEVEKYSWTKRAEKIISEIEKL